MRIKSLLVRTTRFALLTAVLIVAAHGAVNAGVCISAEVDEQVRLPDGSLHDAGILRLCLDRDLSPVGSIHTASIGNQSLGFMSSRRSSSEGVSDQPFMMFIRNADGSLQLYGYALPGRGHMNTYLLQSPPRPEVPLRAAADMASPTALRISGRS